MKLDIKDVELTNKCGESRLTERKTSNMGMDLSSGEMKELDPKWLEGVDQRNASIGELADRIQRMQDQAIPQRENQGPVFSVGEVLEIRGGKFKVHAITSNRIYLTPLSRDGAEAPASPEI